MTPKEENLSVKCPLCLSGPGEPCRGLDTGKKLKQVHAHRASVVRRNKRDARIGTRGWPTAPGLFAGCAACGIGHPFGACGNK